MEFQNSKECPICNSGVLFYKGSYSDMLYKNEGEWDLIKCGNCKHESIYPMLTDDEIAKLYDVDNYYSFKTGKINRILKYIRSKTRRLFPKDLNQKNLLDYGCGDGEVLLLAKALGANVYGIEIGDGADILKKNTGLDIQEKANNEWYGQMDYVRSYHSYEHIVNPKLVMELFKDLVTPETGRVLIGVPNVNSWTANLFGRYYFYRGVPLHLHGYTPESIKLLGESCGLKMVSISTPGSFRGLLGSISIFFQHFFKKNTKEPSNLSLLVIMPIYIFLYPLVKIGNFFLKGDVLEVEFYKPND